MINDIFVNEQTMKDIIKFGERSMQARTNFVIVQKVEQEKMSKGGLYTVSRPHGLQKARVVSVGDWEEVDDLKPDDVVIVRHLHDSHELEGFYFVESDDILAKLK